MSNAFHVFDAWDAFVVARNVEECVEALVAEGCSESERDDIRADALELDDDARITCCLSEDEPEPIQKTCREFVEWQLPVHGGRPFVLAWDAS